jgi:CheY-like chemotaxis protein
MVKLIREYSKDLHVLYVEDDKDLCHSTKEVLENFFQSVDIAYDGLDGWDKYNNFLDEKNLHFDLVITDINMPRVNGIDLCRMILQHTPHQSIIIISAHDESDYLHEAIDMGISGFITKPINQQRLNQILYKTTMAIYDHKFVESHIHDLEKMSLQLEKQNNGLKLKNSQLKKSLRLLDTITHKEELVYPQKQDFRPANTRDNAHLKEQIKIFIKDDLYELKELLDEIDFVIINILNNIDVIKVDSRSVLASLFKKYALTLSMYTFFCELSTALSTFSFTLQNHPLPEDDKRVINIFLLLESFVYDLGRWHNNLSSGDENKLNTFDASNIDNIHLISNMWMESDTAESSEADLDAIFDF